MKVILHIGSDKTGTTTIQNTLSSNQDILKEKEVIYPKIGTFVHHELLVEELLAGKQGPAWQRLRSALNSNSKCLVISSEKLCTLKRQEIALLKKWLANHEVSIVAYIRSADQYLESGIMQQLKSSKSRQDFFRLYRAVKWVPAIINPFVYWSALKPKFVFCWAKVFGKENMIVRPYCSEQWIGHSLISDFMQAIGLRDLTSKLDYSGKKRNITPNIYTVFAMCAFSRSSHPPLRHQFSELMVSKFDQKMAHPISSFQKRCLAEAISRPIFRKISQDFKCPLPTKKPIPKGFAPPESKIIEEAQHLLTEFTIHQKKRLDILSKKLSTQKDANTQTSDTP
ncbi:hypothetical protein ACJJIR_07770 [Microbulbifer sp. SSSA008]|uniref:hypothetical protein n=1 Tax=Microbulbifer sp. SSSA008 TaxID=3243380 RepID=UPI0040390FD2